jgi:hypothetical protein
LPRSGDQLVAVDTGPGMPTRPHSPAILGGLWPATSADGWSDIADTMRQKAEIDADVSAGIRRSADGLYPDNSGHLIDGMHGMYMQDALAVMDQSDLYHSMSRVIEEIAQLIYHARAQLDEIDRRANEEIERLKAAAHGGGIGAALRLTALVGEIAAVIVKARSAAEALSASIAAAISTQLASIGACRAPSTPPVGDTGPSLEGLQGLNFAGGSPRNGMPAGWITPPLAPEGDRPLDDSGAAPAPPPKDRPTDATQPPTKNPPATPQGLHGPKERPVVDRPFDDSPSSQLMPFGPSTAPKPTTATSVPSMPMTSSPSSGISFPQTGLPSTSMPSTSTSAPPLSPSLTNPAAGLTPPQMPTAPPATPNDFSRGLSAGLGASGGAGAPMLPPPVSSPPPPQVPSTAGASGPPLASPAAAPSAAGIPSAAPAPAGPVGAMMPPAAPAGPLPPFTSDLPRSAAVAPASGPPVPSAPAAPLPPAASAPMAPLAPGVIASGVGASAAGAGAGLRSSTPDPLLESASRLVYELMHASRLYAAIDWCAGVFKTPSGAQTVVVSSEGAGYIPAGVFVPRAARMLFADYSLSEGFRARWFGWVNPAQSMLAYAALVTENDPNIELYAVAVSTDHGGSVIPARDAGVPHYEDCSLLVSPIPAESPAPALDGTRMHRLEAIDRAEYARLTSVPDRSESWSTTESTVRVALSRMSTLLGFSVPPVIRQIAHVLGRGEAVTEDRWNELEMARVNAILDSASQRPGRMLESDGASPYARAYHNLARLTELLALWRGNDPQHAEIAYTAAQITTEARLWPTGTE